MTKAVCVGESGPAKSPGQGFGYVGKNRQMNQHSWVGAQDSDGFARRFSGH
jgi:hypothetical protein